MNTRTREEVAYGAAAVILGAIVVTFLCALLWLAFNFS